MFSTNNGRVVETTHSSSDVECYRDGEGTQRDGKLSSVIQVAFELILDAIIICEFCLVRWSAAAEAISIGRFGFTAAKLLGTRSSNFLICAFSGDNWAWPVFGVTKVNFDSFWGNWWLGCLSWLRDTGLQSFWTGVSWRAVESNNNWASDSKADFSGVWIDDVDIFEGLLFFVSFSGFSSFCIEEFALC